MDSFGRNIYVADFFNNCIRKITIASDGTTSVSTLAGNYAHGFKDGPAAEARFYHLEGVTVDSSGNIYVADSGNDSIRRIEYK